jgi:hypothetical protein
VTMLEKLEEDNKFLWKIMLSDKATTHISVKVNKQNYAPGNQNTLMLPWTTLQTASKLVCGVRPCHSSSG